VQALDVGGHDPRELGLVEVSRRPHPAAHAEGVSDARVDGSTANFAYGSPLGQWPGDAAYTGPASFTAS
jgi:hypothetical protein